MTEAINTMFQDAVEALKQGDKARAKDILTRLLKADQNNAMYWIWMSAAVESTKERIYCLQTALKLDPKNGTAKRGLILLGALTPDKKVQPFPLNRPRAWEEKLLLAHEKPKVTGIRATMSSPLMRLAGVGALVLVIGAASVMALLSPRNQIFYKAPTYTPGPSPTFTTTPTFVNASPQATLPTALRPASLSVLLGFNYTATPLPVNTPRPPISQDIYIGAKAAYDAGNWDEFIRQMNQIERDEPNSADIPFYIGEAYRFKGQCSDAVDAYNMALKVDQHFAPAYLGLARAALCVEPGADVTALFNLAIQADPNYADTYLERANYYIRQKDTASAFRDLDLVAQRLPNNALVQMAYLQAYLLKGDNAQALAAAQKANSIDAGLLMDYYYLGQTYVLNQRYKDAIKPLQIYTQFQTNDGGVYALLGQVYLKTGEYQSAAEMLSKALNVDPTQRQAYVDLGTADLQLNNLDNAEWNFKKALSFYPDSFDANIGLTQIFYKRGEFGNSYLQAVTSLSKAQDDTQRALAIYWRGLSQVGRGSIGDAIKDFKLLLSMPENVMTTQMRKDAQDQLAKLVTPTVTPKGGIPTATLTTTPKAGSPTATSGATQKLAGTPTPTGTSTPVATKTP